MRTIPSELAANYLQQGWWTPDTLGDLLARGLAAAPDTEFRVHSDVRPYTGTFGEVELIARRLAAGLRAARGAAGRRDRPAAAELDGGRGVVLGVGVAGRGGRADRALLRPQGTDAHPRRRQAEGVHHRRAVRADGLRTRRVAQRCRSSAWSVGDATSTSCSPTNRWPVCCRPTRPGPR